MHQDGKIWSDKLREHPAIPIEVHTNERQEARADLQWRYDTERQDQVAGCRHIDVFADDIGTVQCLKCGGVRHGA